MRSLQESWSGLEGYPGKRIMGCRALVQRGILLLDFSLPFSRFFNEGLRVKLLGKIFDSRDDRGRDDLRHR